MKTTDISKTGPYAARIRFGACLLGIIAATGATAQTNTLTGVNAGTKITGGKGNTANGYLALQNDTSGKGNVAVGSKALQSNINGSFNVAVGTNALKLNKAGKYNVAVGTNALAANNGTNNAALGFGALFKNTSGTLNTATGNQALRFNTTGSSNVASGYQSMFANTTGGFNVAVGDGSLMNNSTGSGNIAIGEDAGFNLTTGSNNIAIGNKGVAGESGIIRIGADGTHTRTFVAGNVGIGTNSAAAPLEVGGSSVGAANGVGIASFGPSSGQHIAVDSNEIMSYSGNTPSTLYLGYWGGTVSIGANSSANVGIGTSFPSSKLEVRGDIELGPNGQFQAAAGEEKLHIIRGTVSSAGAKLRGSGFTSVRTGVGKYTITFSTTFASAPSCTGTCFANGYGIIVFGTPSTSSVVLYTGDPTTANDKDHQFDFVIVGPR